jgi:hypothetical protein
LLDVGHRLFGFPSQAALWIILVLVILHVLFGATGGWLAWNLGQVLKTRLNSTYAESV